MTAPEPRLSPAILGACAATCAAVGILVPGWALAGVWGGIGFGALFVVDLWFRVVERIGEGRARRRRERERERWQRILAALQASHAGARDELLAEIDRMARQRRQA